MFLHTISKGAIATSAGTWIMIQFNYSFSKSGGALSDLISERQDLLTSSRDSASINLFIFQSNGCTYVTPNLVPSTVPAGHTRHMYLPRWKHISY